MSGPPGIHLHKRSKIFNAGPGKHLTTLENCTLLEYELEEERNKNYNLKEAVKDIHRYFRDRAGVTDIILTILKNHNVMKELK